MHLHDRQITPNNIVDKEKEANSRDNISQNFPWFARDFWSPRDHQPLIFCHLFQNGRIFSKTEVTFENWTTSR